MRNHAALIKREVQRCAHPYQATNMLEAAPVSVASTSCGFTSSA